MTQKTNKTITVKDNPNNDTPETTLDALLLKFVLLPGDVFGEAKKKKKKKK